ncbi:MAG: hypothetical protein ACE5JL_17325 [Dehalococcoidia bacterium]
MELDRRRIRPAGRTTGSVEFTLPRMLGDLEGLECGILIHDGSSPEIGLRPDLAPALSVIEGLWHSLRRSLATIGDIGDVPLEGLELALFPTGYQPGRTPISYLDVLRASDGHRPETASPRERALALSRVVAALSVQACLRLGLKPERAAAVGAVVSYLCTGVAGAGVTAAEELREAAGVEPDEMDLRQVLADGRLPRPIEGGMVRMLQPA